MAPRRFALAASAVLVSSLLAAPAATAADPFVPVAPVEVGPTCAVGAEPVEAGTAAADFPEPTIDCFSTFGAAIDFVTDGDLAAESPAELDRLAAAEPEAMAASSWIVLGYEYKNTGYSGGALVLYGTSGSGCGSRTTYGFPTMPSGWNNVISSARSFSGCWSTHYDSTYYSGIRYTCSGACSSLGSMNNKTSSIVFRPIGTYG